MANKRLSKLKSSELEPAEKGLADEGDHEFRLSGVLSLETGESMNCFLANGQGRVDYMQ